MRVGGLPRQHLIGSGPELSRQVVMLVQTDDPPGGPPPPYYWRALTYDTYTGAGWVADEGETVAVAAGEPINQPSSAQRRVTQDVQFLSAFDGLLYAAGSLSAVDQDVRVARRASDDLFGAMLDTLTYRAQSLVPNVSAATLRSSGSLYPEPIRDRYLSLPDDAPTRVLSLARDLTATAPTPYDRARAITNYLRAFSYTLDLPAPPRNRDVVDYFLFDLQKGYCDYYATAMVVLARAAGLPARLVVGYASGAYDAANARYVVTAADAHSWPEVYFAGVGWIEFEPTPARPPFDYGGQVRPFPTTPPLTPSCCWARSCSACCSAGSGLPASRCASAGCPPSPAPAPSTPACSLTPHGWTSACIAATRHTKSARRWRGVSPASMAPRAMTHSAWRR